MNLVLDLINNSNGKSYIKPVIKGRIKYKFRRVARKNYTCEMCGCEIPKGDVYFEYKPIFYDKYNKKSIYDHWRKRCYNHEPKSYSELDIVDNDYILNKV